MGWINDIFTNFQNYLTFAGNTKYLYHVELSYVGDPEYVLTVNPSGVTQTGIEVKTHEVYKGKFIKMALDFTFGYKDGWGGDILRDELYRVYGKKAECVIKILKRNKNTNDYDEYFVGIIDFTGESYNEEIDENGGLTIKVDVIESSDIQKLQARDKIKLNLYSNTSIGGTTITDPGDEDIEFVGINYYLDARTSSGTISKSATYGSSTTDYAYYTGGNTREDRTGGRFNFLNPTNGVLYTNDSGGAIEMKVELDIPYSIETTCGTGSIITIIYQLISYNSGGTAITTKNLASVTNNAGGNQIDTGTLTNDFDYVDFPIPDGGYLRFQARIDVTKGSGLAELDNMQFTGSTRIQQYYEKSPTIGNTDVACYSVFNAMLKLMRLMMDRDDCFESDYLTDVSNFVTYEYITSVRNLRAFPDPWIPVSFRDLFEHVQSIWKIGMVYNSSTGRFKVVPLTEIYPDTNLGDLGVCTNFKFNTDIYPPELLTGYEQDGDVEKLQGVRITHLKATHSIDTPDDGSLDLRGKFIMSGQQMELYRRQQYDTEGLTDDKDDDQICYVWAPGGITNTAGSFSGWEGIEEGYNEFATPRQNLLRDPFIKGFFKYDTGGKVQFISNKKNVSYTVAGVDEQSDINESDLQDAVYFPENIESDAVFTTSLKDLIDQNGYFNMTNLRGETYKVHVIDATVQDWAEIISFKAKIHNG
jgi:hypothetical protein